MTAVEGDPPSRPQLRDHLLALRRRWRIVLLVLVFTCLLALGYSLAATPQYVSSADVLVEPSGADIEAGTGTKISSDEIATQTQVVTSLPVARLVEQQEALSATPDLTGLVTVQAVGTSRILRITAQDTSAERAASTANTVAAAYLQFRQTDSLERYEQARKRLVKEQTNAERRLDEVNTLLKGSRRGDVDLQSERRTLTLTLTQIAGQIDTLSESLTSSAAGGELLKQAKPAKVQTSPQTTLNVILGALFGLVLGIGTAILRDRFDDVVHDEESVRQALESTVVGKIPHWSERAYRDRLVTLVDPHAVASEEYQRLGVNVRFMLAPDRHDSGAVILTTSSQEGEGKTVTSCNLAVALARLGLRVILVDADFRRASVAPRFGLGDPPGLSDLLAGDDDTASYLIGIGVDGLQVLPAGTHPPNPAALLSSARLRIVLSELATEADLVIVDSPPVLTVADSLELANVADMVLVVTRDRMSRRRQLVAVKEALRHATVRSIGVVCNDLGDSGRAKYSYAPRERDEAWSANDAEDPPADVEPLDQPGRSPINPT